MNGNPRDTLLAWQPHLQSFLSFSILPAMPAMPAMPALRTTCCLFVFTALSTLPIQAQDPLPALGNRTQAFVAATPDFSFHSDFWLNLHDYLYGIAGGGPSDDFLPEEGATCFATLPSALLEPWETAKAYYQREMAERHHRRDPLIRSIRYTITNLATRHISNPQRTQVFTLLEGAAPAYQTCLWPQHDARNRVRIADLISTLIAHADAVKAQLVQYYQEPWPDPLPIDILSYSDYAGANTASGRTDPQHTTLSSTEPNVSGIKGLELILHEATHLMFGARWGSVTERIEAASNRLGTSPPRDLWHALSFYTSGEVVRRRVASQGDSTFVSYGVRTGLFERSWSMYLPAIERYWHPYLDGKVNIDDAITNVVTAIIEGDE